jgi:hypothetical protein
MAVATRGPRTQEEWALQALWQKRLLEAKK